MEKVKTYSLDELTDRYIGKVGTRDREQFEFDLKMEGIGDVVKEIRNKMDLTQEQLGKLVGVQKAQISKIENNIKDVRFSTLIKVFDAVKAKVSFKVEFDNSEMLIA